MTKRADLMSTNDNNSRKNWKQQTSKVVYENPWIEVRHDTVLTPANTQGIYGVVHFKNHAVGILPIDEQGNTWLVRQTRYVLNEASWEIPEGGCPLGEALLDAAKRELKEETGLSASQWDLWLEMELSNSVTDEKATVFVAQDLSKGKMQLEPTEDIDVMQIELSEAIQMALNGEITDAISVAALLKAAAFPELLGVKK